MRCLLVLVFGASVLGGLAGCRVKTGVCDCVDLPPPVITLPPDHGAPYPGPAGPAAGPTPVPGYASPGAPGYNLPGTIPGNPEPIRVNPMPVPMPTQTYAPMGTEPPAAAPLQQVPNAPVPR